MSRGNSLQRLADLDDSSDEFPVNVDLSLCDELKQCMNHLHYLEDLYSKLSEVCKGKKIQLFKLEQSYRAFIKKWRYL